MYGITVYAINETGRRIDLVWFGEASAAAEMEDTVSRLHQEFPAPGFAVEVEPLP